MLDVDNMFSPRNCLAWLESGKPFNDFISFEDANSEIVEGVVTPEWWKKTAERLPAIAFKDPDGDITGLSLPGLYAFFQECTKRPRLRDTSFAREAMKRIALLMEKP